MLYSPTVRHGATQRTSRSSPLAAALLLVLAGSLAGGCDSTATIFPIRILFDDVQVVSAYPAVENNDGEWVRQCGGGDPEGFLFNVSYISTARDTQTSENEGEFDRDNSIRPGDIVDFQTVEPPSGDGIRLATTSTIDIDVDCVEPLPDGSLGSCQGSATSLDLQNSEYLEVAERRGQGQNVLLLIDQSGSMAGLVNDGTFTESVAPDIPDNFGQHASDRTNLRLTAAKRFIRTLNSEDRLGVLAFGEGLDGFEVPCANPDFDALETREKLDACFGSNRELWIPPSGSGLDGLDGLGSGQTGRANLWQAVDLAYDFLAERDDRNHPNHIVVVTDGPDTCTLSRDYTTCEQACSSVTFANVRDKVVTDLQEPNALPIHIHFVQFESPGYEGRDPRQMEIACESLGHYQFINSNSFSATQLAAFQQALEQAMLNVRNVLTGWWQIAAASEGFKSQSAQPTGTPKGSMYALSGTFTVRASSNLVDTDEPFAFGVGQGAGAGEASQWDRRPTVRKACSSYSDCGATDEPGACEEVCAGATLLCLDGANAVARPDTASCTDDDENTGVCCDGACQPSGTICPACQ
ncbi:MAG: vWA domain-containing protein [Myxococcota bacterium]